MCVCTVALAQTIDDRISGKDYGIYRFTRTVNCVQKDISCYCSICAILDDAELHPKKEYAWLKRQLKSIPRTSADDGVQDTDPTTRDMMEPLAKHL